MCGGDHKVSRPTEACQAKSQVPPATVMVMPAAMSQMVRGIETGTAEVDPSGRLCTGSAAAAVFACDIRVTPFPCLGARLMQSNYRTRFRGSRTHRGSESVSRAGLRV